MRFNKGSTYPAGECGNFSAGINDAIGAGNGRPWGSRIACYGKTAEEAEALRDLVLASLEGSVSRNTLMAVAKDVFAACEKEEGTVYGVDLNAIIERYTSNATVVYENGKPVPITLTIGATGVECAGYTGQVRQEKSTQQPVAEVYYGNYGGNTRGIGFVSVRSLVAADKLPPPGTQLYPAQPVPRDMLMAVAEEVRDAAKHADFDLGEDVNITTIVDRYASKAQPEPVNQQLLAALKALFASYKQLADSGDAGNWKLEDYPEGKAALEAIAAAEAAQPVVLDQATIRQIFMAHGFTIKDGQTDLKPYVYEAADALLRTQQPASAQPVAVPDGYVLVPLEPTSKILGAICHAKNQTASGYKATMTDTELASIYRAMLSSSPKPEGGE